MQCWGTDSGRAGSLCSYMADPDLKTAVAQSFFPAKPSQSIRLLPFKIHFAINP